MGVIGTRQVCYILDWCDKEETLKLRQIPSSKHHAAEQPILDRRSRKEEDKEEKQYIKEHQQKKNSSTELKSCVKVEVAVLGSPSLTVLTVSVDVQNLKLFWPLLKLSFKVRSSLSGGGDSSVVRAPDSWLKGRGFESLLERRENFLLQGRLSVLTLISVSVPPPVLPQ